MADDITLNSMSGGPVVATDDSGTGHVQIVKLAYSADGSRTHVDADANGLKVSAGSVVPGTSATSLGKAEDAPHSGNDTGVAVWGVRNDNATTTLTSADGDYSPIAVNNKGAVFVTANSTLPVDGPAGGIVVKTGTNPFVISDGGSSITVDGSVSVSGSVGQTGSWFVGLNESLTYGVDSLTSSTSELIPIAAKDPSSLAVPFSCDSNGSLLVAVDTSVSPVSVTQAAPATNYGKFISAGATYDETSIYGAQVTAYSMYVSNTGATVAYVKLWDSATGSGLIGTTPPVITLAVPASTCQSFEFPQGLTFPVGLAVGFTGGAGDYDMTTVGADEVIANFVYSY